MERPNFAVGNQKIVKFFEHKGKVYAKIEDQVGWSKNDALLTFYLSKIAYRLFPENIPRPMTITKGKEKNTFAIIAEFVPHDKLHSRITKMRNSNMGGYVFSSNEERRLFYKEADSLNDNEEYRKFRKELMDSGLINVHSGGFEYMPQNVIIRDRKPVFVDFINPFYIDPKSGIFFPRVDLDRVIAFSRKRYSSNPRRLASIHFLLKNIYELLPEKQKNKFQYLNNYVKLP